MSHRPCVPVIVAARDEEGTIERCLASLQRSITHARAHLPLDFALHVGADRCRDRTAALARAAGARVSETAPLQGAPGGKVATQQACLALHPDAPLAIFCDADITVDEPTLEGLCRLLLERPELEVATPPKTPLRPHSRAPTARAAWRVARCRGFRAGRTWFDGKLFAIRRFHIPERGEDLPPDRFYRFERGIQGDDLYLSRFIVHHHGPAALGHSEQGMIWFRNPESVEAMYRYYRRVRRELERLDHLCPELDRPQHPGIDHTARRRAPWRDRASFRLFHWLNRGFALRYRAERAWYQHLSPTPYQPWPVLHETKRG